MIIGERLLERRNQMGWAQKEAAHLVEISSQFLGNLEKNKGKAPSLDTLIRICQQYGVTADWLLGLPDAPEPPKPDYSPDQRSILAIMDELPPRKKEEVIRHAEVVRDMYRKEVEEESEQSLFERAKNKYESGDDKPRIIGDEESDESDN